MIKGKICVANVTTYRNYLRRCLNFEEPVSVSKPSTLLPLLKRYYKNNGAFIYGIEVKQ